MTISPLALPGRAVLLALVIVAVLASVSILFVRRKVRKQSDEDLAERPFDPPASVGARTAYALLIDRAQWFDIHRAFSRLLDRCGSAALVELECSYGHDPHGALSIIEAACKAAAEKDPAASLQSVILSVNASSMQHTKS